MLPDIARKRIEAATTEAELLEIMSNVVQRGPAWEMAKEKIAMIRHEDIKPQPWYKQPATWIAFGSLIVAILGWLFPRG